MEELRARWMLNLKSRAFPKAVWCRQVSVSLGCVRVSTGRQPEQPQTATNL